MDRRAFIKAVGAPAGRELLAAKSGGHALRPHLLPAAQDQSQPGLCGTEGRREADRGPYLAGQLHGL